MRKAQFTKTLSMAISPELYDKIKNMTDEKNISISEWFRGVAKPLLDGNDQGLISKKEDKKS